MLCLAGLTADGFGGVFQHSAAELLVSSLTRDKRSTSNHEKTQFPVNCTFARPAGVTRQH